MFRLFKYVNKNISKEIIVINSDTLLEDPELYLKNFVKI